jgi:hypothetical protein
MISMQACLRCLVDTHLVLISPNRNLRHRRRCPQFLSVFPNSCGWCYLRLDYTSYHPYTSASMSQRKTVGILGKLKHIDSDLDAS